jgi:hypothetical protein
LILLVDNSVGVDNWFVCTKPQLVGAERETRGG